MTTTDRVDEAGPRAEGETPRDVGARRLLPAVAPDAIAALGPVLVEAAGVRPGDRVLDVAAGTGNAAIPAAPRRRRRSSPPTSPPSCSRPASAGRRGRGRGARLAVGDAEALPFADGEFDAVLSCVGVMFAPAPPGGRRRAGPGLPPGRHHRPAQLDAGGLHRPDVRHHEAVRAAAAARGAARRRCGATRSTSARCSATGSPRSRRRAASRRRRPVRDRRRSSATTSRPTTARPSRSTRRSPTTRRRSPRWTVTLAELGRRFDRGAGARDAGLGVPAAHRPPALSLHRHPEPVSCAP